MLQKEIDTQRLSLRQLTEADAPDIMAIRANEQVNQYLERPKTCTPDDARNFISKIASIVAGGDGYYWAITLKQTNELIGTICYWNLEPAQAKAEIGYELHPDYQGRGYMTEAIDAVISFGFNSLNFELITACPLNGNSNSVKLLERSGFLFSGDFTDQDTGSRYLDYRLSKSRWLSAKP
ncbi:GNAT family N-acetyltransferase [Mucilaginibacter celer]|uniref:GNAT family N-acetyltransferase n=1 Tax=Mucilaginibacter celer TaxID=2305508 RepID=A0A494VXI5_9SPHI|nr:GNAT family N-acetyltransferase [Mucilaginibacter celer]AYL96038.1 GNAT family N-acetyltransferase [Mucilaginibacter celer]